MRGDLKNKVVPLVTTTYGFKNSSDKLDIQHNREIYNTLKNNNSFMFQVC